MLVEPSFFISNHVVKLRTRKVTVTTESPVRSGRLKNTCIYIYYRILLYPTFVRSSTSKRSETTLRFPKLPRGARNGALRRRLTFERLANHDPLSFFSSSTCI